jgi:hypothetical protein
VGKKYESFKNKTQAKYAEKKCGEVMSNMNCSQIPDVLLSVLLLGSDIFYTETWAIKGERYTGEVECTAPPPPLCGNYIRVHLSARRCHTKDRNTGAIRWKVMTVPFQILVPIIIFPHAANNKKKSSGKN